MDITGKLIKILPEQSGQGKNGVWTKRDFVIETTEEYPKKICFAAWGDKATEVAKLAIGTTLKVAFDIASREYNEKWYTDLKAWRIDIETGAPTSSASVPATNVPSNYSATAETTLADAEDLPF